MNKKIGKIIIGILLSILVIVVAGFGIDFLLRLKISKEITNYLQPMLTEEHKSMHLHVSADVEGESILVDSDIYMVKDGEKSYVVMEQMDVPIYVVENLLFFENGHAFKLAEEMESPGLDYKNLFLQIATVYDTFDISCMKTDFQTNYAAKVTGEQVQKLLEVIMPGEHSSLDGIESLNIEMVAQNEQLHEIKMTGNATLEGSEITLEVVLSQFQIMKEGDYAIPESVRHAVATVDASTLFNLTEDTYRLFMAFEKMKHQEVITGEMVVSADCAMLHFENTYDLKDLNIDSMFSGKSEDTEDTKQLPEVIGFLCMESEIRSVETRKGHVYIFSLDEESMQKISEMAVPEFANYVIHFTEGNVEILLEEESVAAINTSITGDIQVLFSKVPAEVSVELRFR